MEKTRFAVYCIEEYKAANALIGSAVIELFDRYGVLDYITFPPKDRKDEDEGRNE